MRNRKKWKKRLLLLSILAGILYCVEERYSFFRLRVLEVEPRSVLSDELVWQAVPSKADNFWFSLMWDGGGLKKKIESFYPVKARLRIAGWGRYRLELSHLDAFIYVHWNSRMWLVSRNGRMWLANLPINTKMRMQLPDKPILEWDKGMPIPINTDEQKGDISPTSLPLNKIAGWMDTLEKTGWMNNIHKIVAKKIDGRPVVSVMLGSSENRTGEIILKEDTSDWLQLAQAFRQEEIYPGTGGKRDIIEINATFSDKKFTVKTRTAGSRDIR